MDLKLIVGHRFSVIVLVGQLDDDQRSGYTVIPESGDFLPRRDLVLLNPVERQERARGRCNGCIANIDANATR